MKDKTKAFLAGLLDSEGSMSIDRHTSKQRTYVIKDKSYTYGERTYYGVGMAVYNTYRPLMKYLVKHFGGTFRVLRKETETRQTIWSWQPDGYKHMLNVLETILPYIVLSKEQAQLCKRFLELTGVCPKARKMLYEEYKEAALGSLTTETNHILTWKSNLQNAYFSAFFDGEGTASVYKSSTIWITNSNRNILEIAKILYNGNDITGGYRKNAKIERYPEYRVAIPVENMEKFILRMLPYSVIKREQLLLTLENLRGVSKDRKEEIQKELFKLKHPLGIKIQSGLIGDYESAPVGTLVA